MPKREIIETFNEKIQISLKKKIYSIEPKRKCKKREYIMRFRQDKTKLSRTSRRKHKINFK